jgi:hypothetical protein
MTRQLTALAAVGICILFLLPAVSTASIITVFTNFGAGQSYNTAGGNPVGNDFVGDDAAEGDTFTPTVTSAFSSLNIAVSCFAIGDCPDSFTISLDSDNAGLPGAVIESFTVPGDGALGILGNSNAPLTATSVLHPTLTAGTAYWIVVTADSNDSIAWNWNSTSDPSAEAFSPDSGTTWFSPSGLTPGAFEVNGTVSSATPEPGTISLLAGALSLCLLRRFASPR